MTKIKPKSYKLTSVEIDEKLLVQLKAKLLNEKMTFQKFVESAIKQFLKEG